MRIRRGLSAAADANGQAGSNLQSEFVLKSADRGKIVCRAQRHAPHLAWSGLTTRAWAAAAWQPHRRSHFGPVIATRLINYFAAPRPSAAADAFPELTEREKEILTLVAQHQTNPEIARHLHLSPKTIRNHVSNVFTKLQVADRAEAIIRAHKAGLGNLGRR